MWKIFLVLGTAVAALAAISAYARYLEKVSVFFPEKEVLCTPRDIGLEFRDLVISSVKGEKINAWFIPASQARYTVLLCHGNAGNLSTRLEKIRLLHSLGLSILIFDYQGYGKSTGTPSEAGVYKDVYAAYRYLKEELKVPASEILIYGESLGGAVAVDLAGTAEAAGLILESTFSSATEMARRIYPFVPVFVFSIKFDSLSKIGGIRAPSFLFIAGRMRSSPCQWPGSFMNGRPPQRTLSSFRVRITMHILFPETTILPL